MAGTYYQVFLCHRGPDAKRTFVNALHEKLKSKGISSFVDYEIEKGTEIEPHIGKAIENSLFFIIILSPDFASSKWCLDEVVRIMRVKNSAGRSHSSRNVLPVFYNVEPSQVRYQHSEPWDLSKVNRSSEMQRKTWSEALHELSKITGIEYKTDSMFQEEAVKRIVSWVESNLSDPISCEKESKWREQIEELEQMLTSEAFKSKDASIIGVHGTNTREFSDHVVKQFSSRFDAWSVLSDEADPIKKLYSDLIEIPDEQSDKLKFSDYPPLRLQNKRCLLVLDNHAGTGIEHLRPLLEHVKKNFKNQSLMVFTSRFQHRLREVEVDEVIRLPSSEDNGGLLFICHGADIHQSLVNHLEEMFCMRGLDVHLLSENEVLRDAKCLENATVILAIISSSLSINDFQRLIGNTSKIIYISYGRHSTNESSSDIRFDLEVRFEEATCHYDKVCFKLMVEKVMKTLNQADEKIMGGPDFPVGLVKRRKEIEKMLTESKSLQCFGRFGLVGMGGIGKTTTAMSIYNKMHKKFEASFFCLNIREHAGYDRGLEDLQAKILQNTVLNVNKDKRTYDIEHRQKKIEINDVEHGKSILSSELKGINALIVLDDVDHESHIDALYRPLCTLGAKSVVVITTRNRDSLKREQLTEIYEMQELDKESSERLFHWHAFLKPEAPAHLKTVSQDVIAACKGLPLSLKVIGSYLYGHESESDISLWEESFRHLQENEDIFGVLRISYDHLRGNEKEAFLDICCFLIGKLEDYVCIFLEGCYGMGQTLLNVLKSRSLVSTDAEGLIRVHDQLRDMGRHIVREGKKDRVWEEETANDVLEDGGRLSTLRGLSINTGMCFPENEVAMCPELRILVVNNGNMSGTDSHRHNSSRRGFLQKVRCRNLRWLTWENASFEHLPPGLCSEKLQVLNLSGSNIREVPAALPNLKYLWLPGCKNLKVLSKPIGTLMPSLRGLDLYGCSQLEGLDSSLGKLTDLRILNLSECRVPSEIAGT
ncbi:hypothetical protein KP509_36G066600 [Ceratopteris richardii]|uniref:TIR domain-containing protein n=3 Tax=Ceratopteris richardii TaxID=49495 RepID=A0A8T2QDS9_CERRI|nr:hypothetical protein KP509_36G066600 [Ceratopteris richardii]